MDTANNLNHGAGTQAANPQADEDEIVTPTKAKRMLVDQRLLEANKGMIRSDRIRSGHTSNPTSPVALQGSRRQGASMAGVDESDPDNASITATQQQGSERRVLDDTNTTRRPSPDHHPPPLYNLPTVNNPPPSHNTPSVQHPPPVRIDMPREQEGSEATTCVMCENPLRTHLERPERVGRLQNCNHMVYPVCYFETVSAVDLVEQQCSRCKQNTNGFMTLILPAVDVVEKPRTSFGNQSISQGNTGIATTPKTRSSAPSAGIEQSVRQASQEIDNPNARSGLQLGTNSKSTAQSNNTTNDAAATSSVGLNKDTNSSQALSQGWSFRDLTTPDNHGEETISAPPLGFTKAPSALFGSASQPQR